MNAKKVALGSLAVFVAGVALFSHAFSAGATSLVTSLGDDFDIVGSLRTGGNIGIGTAPSPTAKLYIVSTGGALSGVLTDSTSANSYATTDLRNNSGDLLQVAMTGSTFANGIFNSRSANFSTNGIGGVNLAAYNPSGVIRFATGGYAASNERVRIDSAGNVGIGTANPTTQLDISGNKIRLETPKTPASSSEACNKGEIAWDANALYVCVATNTWKKSALVSF